MSKKSITGIEWPDGFEEREWEFERFYEKGVCGLPLSALAVLCYKGRQIVDVLPDGLLCRNSGRYEPNSLLRGSGYHLVEMGRSPCVKDLYHVFYMLVKNEE